MEGCVRRWINVEVVLKVLEFRIVNIVIRVRFVVRRLNFCYYDSFCVIGLIVEY